jgi:hypothetical protein
VGAVLSAWSAYAGGCAPGQQHAPLLHPLAHGGCARFDTAKAVSGSGRPLRGAAAASADAAAASAAAAALLPRAPSPPPFCLATAPQPPPMFMRLEESLALFVESTSAEDEGGVTRGERVERFLKKRRERQYVTKVRYEVRKLNAEARPRFKGRFIKTGEDMLF